MFFAPKPDGNRLFLIDGAAREDSERREIVGFADNELGAQQGRLHTEPQAVATGAHRHTNREFITQEQINLLASKQRASSQRVHRLNLAGVEIEPGHALRLIADGKEYPQPALVHLLVHEEPGKASVNFVLRCCAVRAEQIIFAADGLVERTLLLCRFACLAVAQLELLDPSLDRAQDGEEMELLLNRIDVRLELDRFPARGLSRYG